LSETAALIGRSPASARHACSRRCIGVPPAPQVALVETGNVGVEVATEWLFSAPESTQFEHYTSGG
jgi:hypothetical protein